LREADAERGNDNARNRVQPVVDEAVAGAENGFTVAQEFAQQSFVVRGIPGGGQPRPDVGPVDIKYPAAIGGVDGQEGEVWIEDLT
jgi:hypothetical protein